MAVNPAHFKQSNGGGPDHPVENVSWEDAADFCAKLSALPAEQTASREYRLPTEAEWEYSCRAGKSTPFYFGLSLTSKHANCNHDLKGTSKVGQYPANSFGLFDMHGNVWEWCQDWYGPYGAVPVADPVGPARGERRLLRGGGWDVNSRICRSANRTYFQPSLHYAYNGFRVVWRGGGQDSSRKP